MDAESDAAAAAALTAAKELLVQRRQATESAAEVRPRTLESALRMLPNANLASISVPGAYAKFEAMKAIKQGLHVFLFSDNVPLQGEIELKTEAVKRGVTATSRAWTPPTWRACASASGSELLRPIRSIGAQAPKGVLALTSDRMDATGGGQGSGRLG